MGVGGLVRVWCGCMTVRAVVSGWYGCRWTAQPKARMCAVSMESVAILLSRPTSEERKLSTMRDRGTLVRLLMAYNSSAQLVAMFLPA